jgi:hypothetical protein
MMMMMMSDTLPPPLTATGGGRESRKPEDLTDGTHVGSRVFLILGSLAIAAAGLRCLKGRL